MKVVALVATVLASIANADMYMQAIRGSNNRLDERGRDRANGNRLFDSQNNDYNSWRLLCYFDPLAEHGRDCTRLFKQGEAQAKHS